MKHQLISHVTKLYTTAKQHMPFAENNETRIYLEEHGSGEPLLLIAGLGSTLLSWRHLLPALSEKYRVIVFDNRGAGRSSDINGSVSLQEMAADAVAVMDAAETTTAHVMGTSMGGMIAQELVLNYPGRVRSLILAVTTCGGREAVLADMEVLTTLQLVGDMSAEAAFWAMAPFIYDPSTPRSVLEDDLVVRLSTKLKTENYAAQLQAIREWQGTASRLGQIDVPALILYGENDRLIPPQNSLDLARLISRSELMRLENASHMFAADRTYRAVEILLRFLSGRPATKE